MVRLRGLLLFLLMLSSTSNAAEEAKKDNKDRRFRKRDLKGGGGSSGSRDGGHDYDDDHYYDDDYYFDRDIGSITIKITNLAFQQPLSPMFVMVHNADAIPLFTLGREAPVALQILAENGDPTPLAQNYAKAEGVFFSGIYAEGAPWFGGQDIFITLPYREEFPYVTIASMAINTNDGFVALNGVRILPNLVLTGPMYDAGSEVNNELCASIPGPACRAIDNGNIRSGDGEGFVHVHRGFFGVGTPELTARGYDWRNPVIRVEMMDPFT